MCFPRIDGGSGHAAQLLVLVMSQTSFVATGDPGGGMPNFRSRSVRNRAEEVRATETTADRGDNGGEVHDGVQGVGFVVATTGLFSCCWWCSVFVVVVVASASDHAEGSLTAATAATMGSPFARGGRRFVSVSKSIMVMRTRGDCCCRRLLLVVFCVL